MAGALLKKLGLSAPASLRAGAAAANGVDPVAQQHRLIAECIAGLGDAANKARLAQALSRLCSTHAAGKALRDPAKQAQLRRAELDAAGRLLQKARQAADGAAPVATGAVGAVGAVGAAPAAMPAAARPGATTQRSAAMDQGTADGPADAAPAAAAPAGGEIPPELVADCDKYLQAHGFKATKSEEIVPGDMQCEVWLDGHLVKQPAVCAALSTALPALKAHPVALAQLVAQRWDLAIGIALALSGKLPRQAPTVRLPPPGVRRRQLDGEMYWEPNPAPSTWGNSLPAAPSGWIRDFFAFYGLAADPSSGNDKTTCRFDSKPATLDAAVTVLVEQAALAGYAAGSGARAIAASICADEAAGRKLGEDTADKTAKGDTAGVKLDVEALADMAMPALLAALESIRAAGQLGRLALMKTEPRLSAAIRAVQRQLDDTWQALLKQLDEDDAQAIRRHVYGRIVADPTGGAGKRIGQGAQGLVDQIEQNTKGKRDLQPQAVALGKLDMRSILDVLEQLKKSGNLEEFINHVVNLGNRVGAAVLTVRQEWGGQWERVTATLNAPDREAILERSPANLQPRAGTSEEGRSGIPTELGIGIVFVPKTVHRKVLGDGDDRSEDRNTVQVQGTYTFKFHGKGQSGFEGTPLTVQGGFTYDEKTKTLTQQWMVGAQGAAVLNFFKEAVQVQAFVQLLGGLTIVEGARVSTRIVATGQLAAGGQVVLSHPDILGGNLKLILLPLQVSGTASPVKKELLITTDVQAGLGLQVSF